MATIQLKGITWGHSRGYTPLGAFSQRFSELHPDVEITWKQRTLQEFADFPIEKLTERYDLLIIDHPWVGCADATRCVLPLDEHLSEAYLDDQAQNSVGNSHRSYQYGGHQWGLAIDAATPVASYRADLFEQHQAEVPTTWDALLELASRGNVAVPAIPIDLLMNFYMFCLAHGKTPFSSEEEVIDAETGLQVLDTMGDLYGRVDKTFFSRNPIAVAEVMTRTDDYWYCPFAYGYSNYSRTGYAAQLLTYGDLVDFRPGEKLRSTLGGTGLAVSAFSAHPEWAVRFAEAIVSGPCQSTFYVEHGGQPGHRAAWTSESANQLTHQFFRSTLPALDRAFTRPRYNGYLHFQDHAGDPLHRYLKEGGSPERVLQEINQLYRESRKNAKA
ncbi:multiple sugar transport system substrate-binding protein [Catalinimonas alkaloidigena]|uniref:Multiple sugar transport system substrate-binding protein n=1 Tax=Catalinimonas alkaloidigena TaxID=1075417 RepID=A0A1G9LZQ2_9BACT|nr:extracellular solute-binding protein [Catalinimonas alkaloidigena]SDL67492.1 multiple sugar transport system substrate-binding protein [Catalinimonas alkaloidigena]